MEEEILSFTKIYKEIFKGTKILTLKRELGNWYYDIIVQKNIW